MISVQEADALLAAFQEPFQAEEIALAEATGRVLREPLVADRAYPALDRSRMDGIALAFAAWEMGVRAFPVGGVARAGDARRRLDDASGCVEIMTGAPCPEGADTVIPYEAVTIENGVATIPDGAGAASLLTRGQFIHLQGSDCSAGQVLVPAGARLNAVRVAAASSNGYARVSVTRPPRIEIVTTGDELVEVGAEPAAHQVRASNGYALRALLRDQGTVGLRHAGDDAALLTARLRESLEACDVLIVTGGVSAGKFDEVPGTLKNLGVEKVFHKVSQKPGKPLWFGRGPAGQLVFGLPGNPVSALVCARRYVLPLLHAKSGRTPVPAPQIRLSGAPPASRMTQFLPVILRARGDSPLVVSASDSSTRIEAVLCPVNGSGDFSGLSASDGFVEFPLTGGELLSFFGWDP